MKKKWIFLGVALVFIGLVAVSVQQQTDGTSKTINSAPVEPSESETVSPPAPAAPEETPPTPAETSPAPTETQEPPPTPAEPPDSIYSKLSDEQFSQLTELVVESFYTFTLSDEAYNSVDEETMNCLTSIYNYAYDHNFEIDPDYKAAFETRIDVVMGIPNYDQLEKNFTVGMAIDFASGQWNKTITPYTLDPNDVVKMDGRIYIDAEGYLDVGVKVYWEGDDGKMEEAGEIKDIAYNREINGTEYAYALNVEYFDDPYSSGWRDGEGFLTTSKRFNGKPMYYVDALDPNRLIKKETIDYSGSIQWIPFTKERAEVGMEVYLGALSAKTYMFTIVKVDPANDTLTVKYPSGSVEAKSLTRLDYKNLYTK